jgi:drug/metabolite transporter (DMT)-like permease
LSGPALLGFLYAACIGMALCQACWFTLLGRLGPTASALALLGIPPVGAAASWLLLAAPVSRLDIASLALLLAAALPPLLKRPQQAL